MATNFFEMDWTGTRLTTTTAAALLNKALARLDHPLVIDGSGGVAAGNQRWDAESKDSLINVCALVSQKDAEAILGSPLVTPPDHGGARTKRSCSYQTPMPGGGQMHFTCELELHEWHDAHATFASDQWIMNQGGHALGRGRVATGITDSMTGKSSAGSGTSGHDTAAAAAASPPAAGPPGPWDEAGPSVSGGLEAVKGNVLMRAGSMGNHEQCDALLAKALTAMRS